MYFSREVSLSLALARSFSNQALMDQVFLFSFSKDLHLISISSRLLLCLKSYKYQSSYYYQVVQVLGLFAQIINSLFFLLNEGIQLLDNFLIETTNQVAMRWIGLWHQDLYGPIITYDWNCHSWDCYVRCRTSLVDNGCHLLREDGLTPNCNLPGDRTGFPFHFLQKVPIKNQD